jgi:hypothetical protein
MKTPSLTKKQIATIITNYFFIIFGLTLFAFGWTAFLIENFGTKIWSQYSICILILSLLFFVFIPLRMYPLF